MEMKAQKVLPQALHESHGEGQRFEVERLRFPSFQGMSPLLARAQSPEDRLGMFAPKI